MPTARNKSCNESPYPQLGVGRGPISVELVFRGQQRQHCAVDEVGVAHRVDRGDQNLGRDHLAAKVAHDAAAVLLLRVARPQWPDPELPLHSCYVFVTIQKCTEVPHAGKCGRHFHLSFQYKMYQRVPPTFCRVRYSGSGYRLSLRNAPGYDVIIAQCATRNAGGICIKSSWSINIVW
jgi:hypothetical protein